MPHFIGRANWLGVLALALGFLVLTSASADAEDPSSEVPDIKKVLERLERVEKQNEDLRQQLLQYKQSLPAQPVVEQKEEGTAPAEGADNPSVRKMVDDYLRARDSEARKADDAKKAEAEAKGYEVGSDLAFRAQWRDGFLVETANKDFRVHVGGRLQTDFGWFAPDPNVANVFSTNPQAFQDGADLRRARLRVDGTCWEVIDWVFEYEFAGQVVSFLPSPNAQQPVTTATRAIPGGGARALTSVTVPLNTQTVNHPQPTDVFMDIRYIPVVGNVRIGHFKEPFSLEDYGTSDSFLTFLERSCANDAFSPNRNIGIMLWNYVLDERVAYAAGAFRANSDNLSGNAFDYADGCWAYTGRISTNPWNTADGRYWFHLGTAYSYRVFDPNLPAYNGLFTSRPRYASRASFRLSEPVLIDSGTLRVNDAQQCNFQISLNLGRFNIQSEWYTTEVDGLIRGTVAPNTPNFLNPVYNGGYVQASFFLTPGDYHPYLRQVGGIGRVRPMGPYYAVRRGPRDCPGGCCFGKGAWELAARFDYLDLRNGLGTFTAPVGGTGATAVATAGVLRDAVLGVNWYLNPNFKLQWDYIWAIREVAVPASSGTVNTFAMRAGWDF